MIIVTPLLRPEAGPLQLPNNKYKAYQDKKITLSLSFSASLIHQANS